MDLARTVQFLLAIQSMMGLLIMIDLMLEGGLGRKLAMTGIICGLLNCMIQAIFEADATGTWLAIFNIAMFLLIWWLNNILPPRKRRRKKKTKEQPVISRDNYFPNPKPV